MSTREYAYGHWSLQLLNGLSLPLKVFTSNKTDLHKLPIVRGLKNRKTKQIQILLKEGHELKTLKDIEDFVVSWTDLETYISGEDGSLKNFSDYEGLESLVAENEEKKTNKNMEVLGFYDMNSLCPKYYNGRQYYTRSMLHGEKVAQPMNVQMYQCLISFLKKENLYILARYFSRSGEEVCAIYADDDYLRLSGLYPETFLRKVPIQTKVSETKEVTKLFASKMKEFIKTQEKTPDISLDWTEFYVDALERKGCFKTKPKEKKKKEQQNVGNSLLELLNGATVSNKESFSDEEKNSDKESFSDNESKVPDTSEDEEIEIPKKIKKVSKKKVSKNKK